MEIKKMYMVCKEVGFGKYTVIDSGAIHKTLKSAKKHMKSCSGLSDLIIIMAWRTTR